MEKELKKPKTEAAPVAPSGDNTLSIISVVLGTVSLVGPGLLFGIPAIIMGAIALKRKQGEKGISITGIVTGAISTAVSLVIIGLVVWAFIYGFTHPEEFQDERRNPMQEQRDMFDSQRS